jgi:hypothetical protein
MRRQERDEQSKRGLLGLKIATVLAGAGLIGVIVLLVMAAASTDQPVSNGSPAVPKITASGSVAPTTTPTVDPPAVLTETTEADAEPATPSEPPKPAPKTKRPRFEFAVIGERCSQLGAFSFTRERRPVVCTRRSPSEQPRWQPVR